MNPLYIKIKTENCVTTKSFYDKDMFPNVILDVDKDGVVIGVEVLEYESIQVNGESI